VADRTRSQVIENEEGKARIEDVARYAGVSTMTVSRTVRTPSKVATETRERVNAAISALGYVPNLAAGTLASRRSGVIAIIVPTLRNSIFAAAIHDLADALKRHGFHLMIGYAGYSAENEYDLVRAFIGRQPEALVLTGTEHDRRLRRLLETRRLPTFEIWDKTRKPLDVSIGFDNRKAGMAVAQFLASRGCRKPGVIGHRPETEHRARKRLEGFREGYRQVTPSEVAVEYLEDGMSVEEATAAFARLLKRVPKLDGLFCLNDAIAIAALMEARRMGISLPGDLRIVGFGDFDLAAHTAPRLTTIRIPGGKIGRRAAERILAKIEGRDNGPAVEDIGFELIERESA
jgi:LacI family transcriptional regulator, gluconate utilization system Gnt-I transcriptional repressor